MPDIEEEVVEVLVAHLVLSGLMVPMTLLIVSKVLMMIPISEGLLRAYLEVVDVLRPPPSFRSTLFFDFH